MKAPRTLLFVLILKASFVSAQDSTILWQDGFQVSWSDFLAPAPARHEASAMSDVSFNIDIHSEGQGLHIAVEVNFNRFGSWVKKEDMNDELRKHEQLHFDIYELNARKLRKELQTARLTKKNINEVIDRLLGKYNRLNEELQHQYDRETEHSVNKEQQEKWNRNIEVQLKMYKAFEKPGFSVKLPD